jgi:hypothetical protein
MVVKPVVGEGRMSPVAVALVAEYQVSTPAGGKYNV